MAPLWWLRALDDNGVKHVVKPPAVIGIGRGHDGRQRDATTVDQQLALAALLSRIRRVRAAGLPCKGSLHQHVINALPAPGDAMHVVALCKTDLPERLEGTRLLPLQESLVHGAGAAKALGGQRLPLATRTQHVHDGVEHLSCRLGRSSRPGLAQVILVRPHFGLRDQWLHTLSELIGHSP